MATKKEHVQMCFFWGHLSIRGKPSRREWLCVPLNSPDTKRRREQFLKLSSFCVFDPPEFLRGWNLLTSSPRRSHKKAEVCKHDDTLTPQTAGEKTSGLDGGCQKTFGISTWSRVSSKTFIYKSDLPFGAQTRQGAQGFTKQQKGEGMVR